MTGQSIEKYQQNIINRIFTIRDKQVMLDMHIAEQYGIETKYLNRAVKRNHGRFPESFMFQLTKKEYEDLRFRIGTSNDALRFQIGTLKTENYLRSQIVTLENEQSFKDLGKKWFAFSKMDKASVVIFEKLGV